MAAVVRSAALFTVYDFETHNVSGLRLQLLTLRTHVLQPHRILYGFSAMIQKQLFRVFQRFVPEVKHFYQKNT